MATKASWNRQDMKIGGFYIAGTLADIRIGKGRTFRGMIKDTLTQEPFYYKKREN